MKKRGSCYQTLLNSYNLTLTCLFDLDGHASSRRMAAAVPCAHWHRPRQQHYLVDVHRDTPLAVSRRAQSYNTMHARRRRRISNLSGLSIIQKERWRTKIDRGNHRARGKKAAQQLAGDWHTRHFLAAAHTTTQIDMRLDVAASALTHVHAG